MFDRRNSSDRLLAGCTNSLCSVAVDLGFMYTNISQFKAYTGYNGVSRPPFINTTPSFDRPFLQKQPVRPVDHSCSNRLPA